MALYSISLCAGVGGLDLGLELALPGAFTPVLYCEREAYAAAVLAARMADQTLPAAPVWSDLDTLTGTECRDYLHRATGGRGVEFVYGGIPCQPHSVAGKQLGKADERDLWPATRRFVEANPSVVLVFIENVPGMLATGGAERIVNDLERLHFRCALGLFTAAEVGASHRRERLFILAHREGNGWWPCGTESAGQPRQSSIGDGCGNVAHRRGKRLEGISQGPTETMATGRGGRAEMADAGGARSQERRSQRRDDGQERTAPERDGVPLFPPGPGDLDAWWELLARHPELAPAITRTEAAQCKLRGAPDGLARRVGRLRAIGNGCVPQTVAAAFVCLSAVLLGEDK